MKYMKYKYEGLVGILGNIRGWGYGNSRERKGNGIRIGS